MGEKRTGAVQTLSGEGLLSTLVRLLQKSGLWSRCLTLTQSGGVCYVYLKWAEQHLAVRMSLVLLKQKVTTCAAECWEEILSNQINSMFSLSTKKKTLSLMLLWNPSNWLYLETRRLILVLLVSDADREQLLSCCGIVKVGMRSNSCEK